jgi:hypothetical protein
VIPVRRAARVGVVAAIVAAVAIGGCGSKRKAPPSQVADLVGIGAIPAEARVVVGLDVRRLADAPIFVKAAKQLLLRNPELLKRIGRLMDDCQLDLATDIQSVLLAGGDSTSTEAGRPLVMVASGTLVENELASCVRDHVSADGGTLTASTIGGRTVYAAAVGKRMVWFAFGATGNASAPSTLIVTPSQEWMALALGGGPRVTESAELAPLLEQAQRHGGEGGPAMWVAGLLAGKIGDGLVTLLNGQLAAPPRAVVAVIDVKDGMSVAFDAVMANLEDAKALRSFASIQLQAIAAWAQLRNLGPTVAKVQVEGKETTVTFKASLTEAELAEALSVLDTVDTGPPTLQDAGPGTPGTPGTPRNDVGTPQ